MHIRLYRYIAVAGALGAATLSGCEDGIRPELRGARVEIYAEGIPYDERTIATGATLQLAGNLLDSRGEILEGEVVEWESDNPAVASVDVTAGESVVVTAISPGSARIIARHEIGEDTALVNVASGFTQQSLPTCAGRPAQTIERGQLRVFTANELLPLCLPGGAGEPAEYTMVVTNSGETAASRLSVLLDATGVIPPAAGPTPQLRPTLLPTPQERFHTRLREQVTARLEPLLASGAGAVASAGPRTQAAVGETVSFNVETTSEQGCTGAVMRTGRVRYVSDRAIVVADLDNPQGGFSDGDYAQYAEFFDDHAWPLVTENFGEPSDSDGNGKVFLFFTRAVNDLAGNSPTSGSIIGGFFFNRDLFAKSACAGSNAAEMFYLLVPNPNPAAGERVFTRESVSRSTENVLVHEFQHLVNDSRRLHVNKAPVWEETWLNEGLSHVAEELMFYRSSGLQPRKNLGASAFGDAADREAFRRFQLDNLERLSIFLANPEVFSVMGNDVLATRGATWSFLRYAADRRGGTERELWRGLAGDSKSAGLDNLRQVLGGSPIEWINDWSRALYLDDTGLGQAAQHDIPSWNFRDLYPAARGLWPSTLPQVYPLRVSHLPNPGVTTLPLQGGGSAYRRVGVQTGETASVRLAINQGGGQLLPVPSRLRVAVIRTR